MKPVKGCHFALPSIAGLSVTISDPDFRGQGGLAGSERYLVPRMDGPIVLTQGERGRSH